MFKPLIAGITALSLTFATAAPVNANGLDRDDVGKIVFGLAALAVLNAAIQNNRADDINSTAVHQPAQRGVDRNQSWSNLNRPRQRGHPHNAVLPQECLRDVETRYGTQRLFVQRCLERNHIQVNRLPDRCAVRLFTTNGPRNGFDPLCLREQGYTTSRRR